MGIMPLFQRARPWEVRPESLQANQERFLEEIPREQLDARLKDYYIRQRKRLLPIIFAEDNVDFMRFYAENQRITARNYESDYLLPAQQQKAFSCIAFLTAWSAKNITPEMREREAERLMNLDPLSVTELRRQWSWEVLEDDSVMLTSCKILQPEIIVPPRVGKRKVTALGRALFSPRQGNVSMKKCAFMNVELQKVVIPEGVEHLGDICFAEAANLKELILPDSLRTIGSHCFFGCKSIRELNFGWDIQEIGREALTMCYASLVVYRGSYAEKYIMKDRTRRRR